MDYLVPAGSSHLREGSLDGRDVIALIELDLEKEYDEVSDAGCQHD